MIQNFNLPVYIRFSSKAHLEYAVQAWNPYLLLEFQRIPGTSKNCWYFKELLVLQRSATGIPTGFEKFEYEERFKKLSMTTLNDRTRRGDLI